jgi:hypothetical protein
MFWMSLEEVEHLLARVDIFEPLSAREVRDLASGCDLHRLEAREMMFVSPEAHARRMIGVFSPACEVTRSLLEGKCGSVEYWARKRWVRNGCTARC